MYIFESRLFLQSSFSFLGEPGFVYGIRKSKVIDPG